MSDLSRVLLTEVLRGLVRERQSGVLAVSNPEATKGVFLRDGRIVFASSTVESDKLGASLIRLGRIGRREFAAAYEATRLKGGRLGAELVGAGVLSEEELGRIVAHQVRRIVLSLFTWTAGDADFEAAAEPIPPDLAIDVSTYRLLFEGARIFPDEKRVEAALGDVTRRLAVSARPPFDWGQMTLTPAERQVLSDAGDTVRIADLLARPTPRPILVRAVYALLAGGALEEIRAEQAPDFIEENTGTFRIAMAETSGATAVEDPRERALRAYEALPRATHYQVLGVAPEADQATIVAQHRRLEGEAATDGRALAGDVRMASILSTLGLRRREACRILSDPELRRAYDRSLARPETTTAPRETAESQARAHQLANEAAALLEKGHSDEAVSLLLQAVQIEPRAFRPRRALALALAHHPRMHRSAERHFLTALDLEPSDVDLRFRLALYYRKAGLAHRAIIHLRTILGTDPEHEGAIRELKTLSAPA